MNRPGTHGEESNKDDGLGEGEEDPLSRVWESTQLRSPKGNDIKSNEAAHMTMSKHSKQPYGFLSPNRAERRSPQPVRPNDTFEASQGATLRVRKEASVPLHYYIESIQHIIASV